MKEYNQHLISGKQTIREALERLNTMHGPRTLFVLDPEERLEGTFTDGDARRAILAGASIEESAENHMFTSFRSISTAGFQPEFIREARDLGVRLLPLVDGNGQILRVYDLEVQQTVLPLDAVIMAGGRGKRLAPLTDKTPKPLLEVGGKPILEHNVDRLQRYGIDRIGISVRYLGEQIESYFGDGSSKGIDIHYIREDKALGTLGCLSMLDGIRYGDLLVMNSDLLTTIDIADLYRTYRQQDADLIVASSPYQIDVPYAVLETEGTHIRSFREKPTYTYFSNAGIYIMRGTFLGKIPRDRPSNATDLMETLIEDGCKVVHYPILGYWLDIGRPYDYRKAQRDIEHLNI